MLLAITAAGLWATVLQPNDGLASVTVLDVGQGQAVLLRDCGHSVLVDVGPPDGAAVLALSRAGGGRDLDAVVLTHGDADHTGGLREVLRRYHVGSVLTGDVALESTPIDIGDRVRVSDRMSVEVLSPPTAGTAQTTTARWFCSCVSAIARCCCRPTSRRRPKNGS